MEKSEKRVIWEAMAKWVCREASEALLAKSIRSEKAYMHISLSQVSIQYKAFRSF
jgi:hypothetical protein